MFARSSRRHGEHGGTANDRFKRSSRRLWWMAGAVAVGFHAVVLFMLPPIPVESLDDRAHVSRLILAVGEWRSPVCHVACAPRLARYDTLEAAPVIVNGRALNAAVQQVYPRILWRYMEPSSATVEVSVSRGGEVRAAALIETSANGADEALLELARRMRFAVPAAYAGHDGLIGTLELTVRPPM